MDSLQSSINITLPIFIMMSIGWFSRKKNIVTHELLDGINRFNSKILLPILLFYNTYTTDLQQVFNIRLLTFAILSLLFLCIISFRAAAPVEKVPERRSVTAISVFRSNYIIFGLVIAKNLCGEDNLGPVSMLAAIIIPLMHLLCIIVLEMGHPGKTHFSSLLLSFVKNPILLASVAGFTLQYLPFRLPDIILEAVHDVSRCASPLSFIVLGGMFRLDALKKNFRNLMFGLIGKLVVVPAIMIPLAIFAGFSGPDLVALISLYIAPVAINLLNFAKAMNADVELAGQYIVLSSIISIFTIFCWIFIINLFNIICLKV